MATKKQVEDLKAKIAELEAQKRAIEEQILAAYGEAIAAERELNRHEKLTPAMRRVLVILAGGGALKCSRWRYPVRYWAEDANGDSHESVRSSVFYGLKSREAISDGEREGARVETYYITDHGKRLIATESARAI